MDVEKIKVPDEGILLFFELFNKSSDWELDRFRLRPSVDMLTDSDDFVPDALEFRRELEEQRGQISLQDGF